MKLSITVLFKFDRNEENATMASLENVNVVLGHLSIIMFEHKKELAQKNEKIPLMSGFGNMFVIIYKHTFFKYIIT